MNLKSIWQQRDHLANLCGALMFGLLFIACSNPMTTTGNGNFTIPTPPAGGSPFSVTYYNFTVDTTGKTPVDATAYTAGSTVTVLGNTGSPALSWPGFTFVGWNTKQVDANNLDGGNGGTFYSPGQTFLINTNTYLFGVWQKNQQSQSGY